MKDWLIKRLTPRKKQEERWTGLAAALQRVWEEDFDPHLLRLENLRSYFLADDADLALKLREMGDYFTADIPRVEDKPITVAWRRLELEYKDLELILTSVFRRHYSDLPVDWFPLFAPLDQAYGTSFTPAEGPWPTKKNAPPEGMFLTSRGLLGVDMGYLFSIGLSKQAFMEKGLPLLKRTKPLHIVYDGLLWYIRWDIPFECDFTAFWEREGELIDLPFSVVGARFDFTPADVRHLDQNTLSLRADINQSLEFSFIRPDLHWHLDFFLPEGFPESWLPLDTLIMGNEKLEGPFYLACSGCHFSLSFRVSACRTDMKRESGKKSYFTVPRIHADSSFQFEKRIDHIWDTPRHHLDYFPHFDDFPADIYPLDMPIGGCHG